MGPRQGRRCFGAPWAWRIGEQSQSMPNTWRSLDAMDEQEGGAGLIFSLRFDPMRAGFDRALVSFPVSALISRLLGWGKKSSQGRPQGSVMVAAAAVALYVAALFVSDQQPRRRRLAAARPASATKPRALPAPEDGLRILSSNDEYLENVIHGASIGAGDDEPVVVARVQTMPLEVAGTTETEHDQLRKEKEEEEDEEVKRFKELWLSLVEREQRLELRQMDLDGLREQEATVKELENRVGVAAVEARLLELKVLSLREENEQLKVQAAELEAVRVQLGRAKEKLRALTERVQAEREESRSKAAALRDKVTELEKAKAGLEEENRELARRLQDAEQVSSAVIGLVHEDNIVDEAHCLREAEREDDDRELPLSDKAKELMLQYGGSLGLYGYDPAIFSPLNESIYGDGGNHHRRVGDHDEPWRSPVMPSPSAAAPENRAGHGKHKFLRNIKKLLASSRGSHGHDRKSKKAATDDELGKAMRSLWLSSGSHDALAGDSSCESTPLSSSERTPLRSVTAVDLHARARGGGAAAAATEAPSASRPEAAAQLARSKSDLGASVRREATRYHALRPESTAVVGTYGGYHSPEKFRTHSDELRSS